MADEQLPDRGRITLAGDKAYDTGEFVASCRTRQITPHVAQNLARPGGSALDARTTRHPGYGALSQWMRKRIEEGFGWMKTVGGLSKTPYCGRQRVQMHAYFVAAAYNLLEWRAWPRLPHETITFIRRGLRTDQQKPSAIRLIYSHCFARGYGTD